MNRRRLARVLAVVFVVLLLAAGAAISAVSWKSAKSLVHPEREFATDDPSRLGLPFQEVELRTEDGLRLSAWWMPANGTPRASVVFLHGYGDNKNQSLHVAPFLHEAGYNVLAFDFRAHGRSEGDQTTVGLVETRDVQAAILWLMTRSHSNDTRVVLFGWSMGAATAINAAADLSGVEALVADSAFATLTNIASNSITYFTDLPKWPFGPLAVLFAGWMVGHDVGDNRPIDAMESLDAPVLVIQGSADVITLPDDDGRALAEAAPEGSALWLVEGADHVEALDVAGEEYERRVLAFLDGALARQETVRSAGP